MAKYREKPVIVEAEPYKPGMEDGFDCGAEGYKNDVECSFCEGCKYAKPYIKTLEGKLYISLGDWIITGVKGERYPIKPDIFKQTYEPVEPVEDNYNKMLEAILEKIIKLLYVLGHTIRFEANWADGILTIYLDDIYSNTKITDRRLIQLLKQLNDLFNKG